MPDADTSRAAHMPSMTDNFETIHPRASNGRFSEKPQSVAEVSLPVPRGTNRVESARHFVLVDGREAVVGIADVKGAGRMLLVDVLPTDGSYHDYVAALNINQVVAGNIYMHPELDIPGSGGAAYRGVQMVALFTDKLADAADLSDFGGRLLQQRADVQPADGSSVLHADHHRNGSDGMGFYVSIVQDDGNDAVLLIDFMDADAEKPDPTALAFRVQDLAEGNANLLSESATIAARYRDAVTQATRERFDANAARWAPSFAAAARAGRPSSPALDTPQ